MSRGCHGAIPVHWCIYVSSIIDTRKNVAAVYRVSSTILTKDWNYVTFLAARLAYWKVAKYPSFELIWRISVEDGSG